MHWRIFVYIFLSINICISFSYQAIKGFTDEKCLIGRYQSTWLNFSTWQTFKHGSKVVPLVFIPGERRKTGTLLYAIILFKWPGLFSILLFFLFLWDWFSTMLAFWFTECDFELTYFSGYIMFRFFNGFNSAEKH